MLEILNMQHSAEKQKGPEILVRQLVHHKIGRAVAFLNMAFHQNSSEHNDFDSRFELATLAAFLESQSIQSLGMDFLRNDVNQSAKSYLIYAIQIVNEY